MGSAIVTLCPEFSIEPASADGVAAEGCLDADCWAVGCVGVVSAGEVEDSVQPNKENEVIATQLSN